MLDVAASTESPKSAEQVQAIVAAAGAAGRRLEIIGGGTKRGISPVVASGVLSLAKLDKVIDYAPEELVLTVQAGARLAELEKLVAAEGQMLPFEPPHLGKVLAARGKTTIGGAVAANLSGPRRIRAGAARDHVLGFAGVTGRGEVFKAGGKVVKNVTGYDLSKLIAGSWGTLAVMTEITLKVLPAGRTETTLLFFGLDERRAGELMTLAMGTSAEVSGAAHLPAFAARRPPLKADLATTALRLEGFPGSVTARAEALLLRLRGFGRAEALDAAHSRDFWRHVRDVDVFAGDPRPLWRLSVPPAAGWQVARQASGDALYDWAGGLVWMLSDAPAAQVQAAARALGGHAGCWRGGERAFAPLDPPLAALSGRVKAAFDPLGVLNPGKFG
ncbi:glycolate oxidase subunit GlcE [Phenylobacterium sp.]|jgi:glycolate oxidase FAD binding subunit|uniref:glycolate oxidase subunit GlcE n=1 Tax=Phenylobacterium sp. TaxID=1871053 RepID=UPI002F93DB95